MNSPAPASTSVSTLRPHRRGIHHPRDEAEVRALVGEARASGRQLRVVGAGRSLSPAIYPDAYLQGRPLEALTLSLDRMRAVEFDDESMEVTAQAGCKIAYDPRDWTGSSSPTNNLIWQLDQHGWALPILAGGNIQTVGGYLVGGSDGGSLQHAMGDCVVGIRLVYGRGRLHDLRVGDPLFDAAGVTLGLLGVVTAVAFRCEPRFDLTGREQSAPAAQAGVGLAAGEEHRLPEFLRAAEYGRIMWWPQPGLERAVVWQARRMTAADEVAARDADGKLRRRPYVELPHVLGRSEPVQAAAGLYLAAHGQWPEWFYRVAGRSRVAQWVARRLQATWRDHDLQGRTYKLFVGGNPDRPQRFRDTWWQGLSMDADVDERLMPTGFSELWIPLSRAAEAARILREHFETGGHEAAGNFVTELYGGRRSRFWLSPGYGEDQLRVNVFWFEGNKGDPVRDHYATYWRLLEPLGFRLHWSKALPPADQLGAAWFRSRYPRFDDFMEVREDLDPDQIFVTDYWRDRLGIADAGPRPRPAPGEPPPPSRTDPPRPWPLLFPLEPVDHSLVDEASHRFDNRVVIDAPIDELYDIVTQPREGPEWITFFRGADWLTEPFGEENSALIETFAFMSARLRVVDAEPPVRCISSVDACTLPLGQSMTSEWRLREVEGGTEVHWQVCYTPGLAVRPIHPLLRPFFAWVFRSSLKRLKARLEG